MDNLAPIAIFCYNRPDYLKKLLETLEMNRLANKSDIYFFVDYPKSDSDKLAHKNIVSLIEENWQFKSKNIIVRSYNYGVKKNIMDGITQVINDRKKLIILEDDLEINTYFLDYMNKALNLYENNKKVWHIGGYNYPTLRLSSNKAYFTHHMNCWGWATWEDRWNNIFDNLNKKIVEEQIKDFNFKNLLTTNYNQLTANENKKISTWAIFWYQTIFLNNGYCLMPSKSVVLNKGFENGEHGTGNQNAIKKLSNNKISNFPKKIIISKLFDRILSLYFLKNIIIDYVFYHIKKRFPFFLSKKRNVI